MLEQKEKMILSQLKLGMCYPGKVYIQIGSSLSYHLTGYNIRSKTNREDFGGRVLTSSIYQKNSDGPFLWGGSASKKYYNRSKHFCYIPNIKLYLTETESQPTLPKGLDPIKITSDYLKEFHDYGLKHMKNHFGVKQGMDTVTQANAQLTKEDVSDSEESHSSTLSKKIGHSTILPSQIRYIISYPDNEGDRYQNNLKKALMMAEIINKDDPEERLVFIKESAAVAHYCIQQSLPELKPSRKPYLICDVGSKVFGISSVMIDELVDTGKITSHSQQAINKWGTLELDRRMKKYLKKRFQGSPGFTADQINATIERIFEYYLEDIKVNYFSNKRNMWDLRLI
jgi:hypothetical protein